MTGSGESGGVFRLEKSMQFFREKTLSTLEQRQ